MVAASGSNASRYPISYSVSAAKERRSTSRRSGHEEPSIRGIRRGSLGGLRRNSGMRNSSSVAELADFTRYSFRAAGQNNRRYLLALIASNTLGSNNAEVSPSSRPSATSRSSRRMILPLRVFGNSGTT
jgi:hypothetical protein